MHLMAKASAFFLLTLAACEVVPEYPKQPEISYASAFFQEMPQTDYIYLSFNYKDGDGDLGLNDEEMRTLDSASRFNIFPVLYRKVGNTYLELKEFSYNGTFPRLRQSLVAGPIEGSLQYRLGSFNFFNEDSSIAKIRVYIRDRAGNKSNVIETPPFPVVYR